MCKHVETNKDYLWYYWSISYVTKEKTNSLSALNNNLSKGFYGEYLNLNMGFPWPSINKSWPILFFKIYVGSTCTLYFVNVTK